MKVATVRQCKFVLTEEDESLNSFLIVVVMRAVNQRINTIHLHRDFPVYRNITTNDSFTELAVVVRHSSVR